MNSPITKAHLILYVKDQRSSRDFYLEVLGILPTLDVPGMTEFEIGEGTILGLMPYESASRLLGREISPSDSSHVELYLLVDDPAAYHARALAAGADEASPLMIRDWGQKAAYSTDPSGHVIAFAQQL